MATMKFKTEKLFVVDDQGNKSVFTKRTPVVTETFLDGETTTYDQNATVTTLTGEHVNVRSETEFETLSGKHWRLTTP